MISVAFINPPTDCLMGEVAGGRADGKPMLTIIAPGNNFTVSMSKEAALEIALYITDFIAFTEGPMTAEDTIDTVEATISAVRDSGMKPPYLVTLPSKCVLFIDKPWDEEAVVPEPERETLRQRLMRIPDVKKLRIGSGSGTSVQSTE